MEENKIVARYLDGKIVKGVTKDFAANKGEFHVYDPDNTASGYAETIQVKDLKAVFFVESFAGDRARTDKKSFRDEPTLGNRIICRFKDGEILYGYTHSYAPNKHGFFVFTSDAKSNNKRVFVLAHALKGVKFPDEEEKAGAGGAGDGAAKPGEAASPAASILSGAALQEFQSLSAAYRRKDEKEFRRLLEGLLGKIWFTESTKDFAKRKIFSSKWPRYFGRGPVKEIGVLSDPELPWPRIEIVPRQTNTPSDYIVTGQKQDCMSPSERQKVAKAVRKRHADLKDPVYVCTSAMLVWNEWKLAFYDSRSEYFTILPEKDDADTVCQIGYDVSVSNLYIFENAKPVAADEKALLALAWEVEQPYHPNRAVRKFE
jgi:hypothetical protein